MIFLLLGLKRQSEEEEDPWLPLFIMLVLEIVELFRSEIRKREKE